MKATDKSAAAILATPGSSDFDDIGALLAAIRNMAENSGEIPADDARHLYVFSW